MTVNEGDGVAVGVSGRVAVATRVAVSATETVAVTAGVAVAMGLRERDSLAMVERVPVAETGGLAEAVAVPPRYISEKLAVLRGAADRDEVMALL